MLPNGTIWNSVQLPAILAAIELKRDHPAKTIELLASAIPWERAFPEVMWLRGQAYLRLGRGQEAALEFRKILDHKGANFGQVYALAQPALARAYALAGNNSASRQTYEEFFALWKNADAGLQVLNRAHAEFVSQQK